MEYIKGLVSVVIPTHNRQYLLQRAALSALKQTYKNIEVIIVSDGSTDDTATNIKTICDSDKRTKGETMRGILG